MSLLPQVLVWGILYASAAPGAEFSPSNSPPNGSYDVPTEATTWLDGLAAALSPRIRELRKEREEVLRQLSVEPVPNRGPTSEAIGFHSNGSSQPNTRKWVQVDLGSDQPMDLIALVPAQVAVGGDANGGYGFPVRFRVEVGREEDLADARLIADYTGEDYPNPGNSPVLFEVSNERARYVRLTATKLWQRPGSAGRMEHAVLALGELMVISGARNLAIGRPVRASDATETPPQWAKVNLVDGQSILGLPLEPVPSRLNGYHSKEGEKRQDAIKWVQVDLGKSLPLEEVRLIPARPRDWASIFGFGFPLRFRVEASEDPSFANPITLRSEEAEDFRNPGENIVVAPGNLAVARYVRVSATKLWSRGDYYAFALAELQAFSGGTNAALGAEVTAFDSVEYALWSTRALVDGYSSQQRLVDLGSWLRRLGHRTVLESRLHELETEHARKTLAVLRSTGRWSIAGACILLLAAAALAYRYRMVRLLELERLRTSIAADLHDELGTRLTRISMLTDVVDRQMEATNATKPHVAQIFAMTHEAVRTMDEIVWAVNPRNDTLEDLANYIFHFAQEFFRYSPVRCRLDIPPDLPPLHLTTEVRHNLFLAVKEALNNVLKHAQATNARVTLQLKSSSLAISVEDDGRGFTPEAQRPGGNGLRNMRQRLESLGGRVEVESTPGRGTTVLFLANLRTAKQKT
jgi:signal transduction histidine kinase